MNNRLAHDAAFAMATRLLELVETCLREEEKRDAWDEFYAVCLAGVEAFSIQQSKMQQRINPSRN